MLLMRLNKIVLFSLMIFTISLGKSTPGLITFNITDIYPHTKEIIINFTIPKKDFIYKDFITCSVDNPNITLSSWKTNKQPVAHYDSSFKEAKQIFDEDFTISLTVSKIKAEVTQSTVHLYCSYYRNSEKKIN